MQEEAARQQAPSYGKQSAASARGAEWAARYRAPPPLHHAPLHARLPQPHLQHAHALHHPHHPHLPHPQPPLQVLLTPPTTDTNTKHRH